MGSHINKEGQFQSDKHPSCPPDKVPLSVRDKKAQPLLWEYENEDKEFVDDLKARLLAVGFEPPTDKMVRINLEDLKWLIQTLANANDIIEGDGLDDDDEAPDINDRLEELAVKYGVEC